MCRRSTPPRTAPTPQIIRFQPLPILDFSIPGPSRWLRRCGYEPENGPVAARLRRRVHGARGSHPAVRIQATQHGTLVFKSLYLLDAGPGPKSLKFGGPEADHPADGGHRYLGQGKVVTWPEGNGAAGTRIDFGPQRPALVLAAVGHVGLRSPGVVVENKSGSVRRVRLAAGPVLFSSPTIPRTPAAPCVLPWLIWGRPP